jgi:uncharacterized protein YjbI with pentapeptide repeats
MLGRVTDGGSDAHGESRGRRDARLSVIGWRSIVVWAIAALAITAATTIGLWIAAVSVDTERASAQLEAIRTGLSVGVGAGGVFALWLATRRQRSTEFGLTQQERTIEATIADADEKRITELYTKAAEQIGHDKAPVRLAGIYALERLAQDNPRHRQTIVNVLCAYLRMPFMNAARALPAPAIAPAGDDDITTFEEREIRVTIQRILCTHLRPFLFVATMSDENQPGQPNPAFWPGISVNLDGALLINFDFRACELAEANFSHAAFHGKTTFRGATFTRETRFRNTTFQRGANFENVRFDDFVWFRGTRFLDEATFSAATFAGASGFKSAEFAGDVWFRGTVFHGPTVFHQSVFHRRAAFGTAEFLDTAGFGRSAFKGTVELRETKFHRGAWFRDVHFGRQATFSRARFHYASFRRARFDGEARFGGVTFHREAEFTQASFAQEVRFGGAVFEGAARFGSAVFHGAARFTGACFDDGADFEQAEFGRTGSFQGARFRDPASRPQGNVDLTGAVLGG